MTLTTSFEGKTGRPWVLVTLTTSFAVTRVGRGGKTSRPWGEDSLPIGSTSVTHNSVASNVGG